MRPTSVTLTAAGISKWIPVNEIQIAFGIGLGVTISNGANLTYSVQHTFDDPNADFRQVVLSRTTTTATITDNGHNLVSGDCVIVSGSGDANLDGTYTITVVDANSYTYTVANTGAASGSMYTNVRTFRVFTHATLVGLSARTDGNYAFPIQAVRLNITSYTSGNATLTVLQGMGR
jgi:hypothetical protein